MCRTLSKDDHQNLETASGWLALKAIEEARKHLDLVSAEAGEHPDVMEVRCMIELGTPDFRACLSCARKLAEAYPERAEGPVFAAKALRWVEGPEAAREHLAQYLDKFRTNPLIRMEMAGFAAASGQLAEARQWIEFAFAVIAVEEETYPQLAEDFRLLKSSVVYALAHYEDLAPLRAEVFAMDKFGVASLNFPGIPATAKRI